jgi:hypothetical protein
MHDSRRYRDNAAECLLAAQAPCQPYHRKLRLSMAASWLSLARQDEAMDDLLASRDTAKPVKGRLLRFQECQLDLGSSPPVLEGFASS